MTKLLIEESCLIFQPTLAKRFGLNEAIILQQLHYWTVSCKKEMVDGNIWIYNTYSQWQKQFPFWSEVTVKRTIKSLENQGIIFSKSNNKSQNKTKFYAINYSKISEFKSKTHIYETNQIDLSEGSKRPVRQINLISSYNIETKTTTKEYLSKRKEENSVRKNEVKAISANYSSQEILHGNNLEREMIDIWNNIFVEEGREEVALTNSRKIALRKAASYFKNDLAKWTSYCQKICSSKFLMGEVTDFKASIDWSIREDIIIKIIEGTYQCGNRVGCKRTSTQNISEIKPKSSDPLWLGVVEKFKQHHGEALTASWLNKLDFMRVNRKEITLSSDSKFIVQRIESLYLNQINSMINQLSNGEISKVYLKHHTVNIAPLGNYPDVVCLAG
jgi:hypothetical protein